MDSASLKRGSFPRNNPVSLLVLLLLFQLFGTASQALDSVLQCPAAHRSAEGLRVSGNLITYRGQPVQLHGVAVGDILLARGDRPLTDYWRISRSWNANIVRLSIHPAVWKWLDHEFVLRHLEVDTYAAIAAGMFVIIDWHVIGWPNGYYPTPYDPQDLYDTDFELARDFWRSVAERFAGEGRVIFELWTEPLYQEDDTDPPMGQLWPVFKPYMEELIVIIRRRADNIVLVTSNVWAYNLSGIRNDLIADENTAYTWHVYAGHDYNDEKLWEQNLDLLQTVRPVVVTEWGYQQDTDEHFQGDADTFGKKFVRDFIEAKGLHSTAWCWHPDWGPFMLDGDWKTPNEYGRFVRKFLRRQRLVRP